MARFYKIPQNLDYLNSKPKIQRWELVAGPKVNFLQTYDLIYDDTDLRIRQLPI